MFYKMQKFFLETLQQIDSAKETILLSIVMTVFHLLVQLRI